MTPDDHDDLRAARGIGLGIVLGVIAIGLVAMVIACCMGAPR